jgi:hypothetical protein
MSLKKWIMVLSIGILFPSHAFAEKTFLDYCLDSYVQKGSCPEKTCDLKCPTDEPGCVKVCLPKECPAIAAQDCPLQYCQVMTDCSNEKICHYKMAGEQPECGDLAYAGQDVECCPGLVKRCGIEFIDGRCDMEGKNSVYNLPICIPCGDGICSQFEDHCNCPEDCLIKEPEAPKPPAEEKKNDKPKLPPEEKKPAKMIEFPPKKY